LIGKLVGNNGLCLVAKTLRWQLKKAKVFDGNIKGYSVGNGV
jgi:hypothetical protein